MPKSLLRYSQVRRLGTPDVQESDAAYAEGRYFEANCFASDAINDFVHTVGVTGSTPNVTKVNPLSSPTMPAIGVIVQKPTATSCLVQVAGIITTFSPLVPGARYFVGLNSQPNALAPSSPAVKQVVGTALGVAKLLLAPNLSDTSVSSDLFEADCSAGDNEGNLVQLVSPTGGIPKVQTVDPSDDIKVPAVGILIEKIALTVGIVQRIGTVDLASSGISDLVPGKRCFIWYDGRPFTTYPGNFASSSGYCMAQVVGVAMSTSVISLVPDLALTKVFTAGLPAPPPR